MKKMIILLVISIFASIVPTKAETLAINDFIRLDNIGIKLIKANNIKHRFIFNFTSINSQGAFPIINDTSLINDYNLHNNREITIYVPDYAKMTSDDEVAALLAHNLAQGENSYKGVMHGQFFVTKEILCGKSNEKKYDKTAVDYLVNAGYNPVALLTAYNKTLPEWRGDFWARHNKASVRMKTIHKYIEEKYPQYLEKAKVSNTDFFPSL